MLKQYSTLKESLRLKINNMKGDSKPVLLVHYEILDEMSEDDQVAVLDLLNKLLHFNGMSEISAFETAIQMARKVAQTT